MSEDKPQAVSPLRQRMIEDMRMRKMAPKTQQMYIRGVCRMARYLGRSPDTATAEDLRRFQLHLVEAGVSAVTINATLTACRFLFEITLDRPQVMAKVRQVRVEQKLPVVLSREEVALLIESAPNLKMKTAVSLAREARLRAGEGMGDAEVQALQDSPDPCGPFPRTAFPRTLGRPWSLEDRNDRCACLTGTE
jgi:integrase/recombinase XerD